MTTKLKLSPKQKEVVLAMREKVGVFRWVGMPICKFNFRGKAFRYDMGTDLQDKGLIEYGGNMGVTGHLYQLTELGKSIDL